METKRDKDKEPYHNKTQVGALSRVGVSFTEAQAEILKTGTEAEKTAALVEVLGGNFGGLAQTTRQTTEGAVIAMKNAFGDMKEVLGAFLLPILGKVATWFSSKIPTIQDFMVSAFERINPIVMELYEIFDENILPILKDLFSWIKSNMPTIKDNFEKNFSKIFNVIKTVWGMISEDLLPILKDIFSWVQSNMPIFRTIFDTVFTKIFDVIKKVWKIIFDDLLPIFKMLYDWVAPYFPLIGDIIGEAFDIIIGVANNVIDIFDDVIGTVKKVLGWIDKFNKKPVESKSFSVTSDIKKFGGARALGGPVKSNIPYLVGEKGPELFTPSGNGNIIPNNKLSNTGDIINNFNIANMNIRSEQDVKNLARELYNLQTSRIRGMGIVPA